MVTYEPLHILHVTDILRLHDTISLYIYTLTELIKRVQPGTGGFLERKPRNLLVSFPFPPHITTRAAYIHLH